MTDNFSSPMTLYWYDYVIFAATIIASSLIGIYFGFCGSKQSTVKEYLLAGKKMSIVPIAVSLAVSHFSGTTILGVPADVYRYGSSVWLTVLSFVVMGFLGVFVYLPVFFKLQVTSIYEYLEKRFDRKTRVLGLILYILAEILIIPIHIYSPSLIFATASGININLVAFVLCVSCVFYTTVGGLKTVIWTDILQFVIIVMSLTAIYIVGLSGSGGFGSVWKKGLDGQRLAVFNFGIDLTARDSFWGYTFGFGTTVTSVIVVHQTGVQKFLALPTFNHCKWSIVYIVVSFFVVQTFCVFIGLEIYARYQNCDPLTSNQIRKHDQIVPYYVSDLSANLPGISGLLIATICSASLSSVSSNLNALAGVIYTDIICLVFKRKTTEKRTAMILKFTTFITGILCTCLVFAVEHLGELFSITLLVSGITQGPLLGVFTLGILFPRSNAQGAFYGTIGGFISALCLTVPSKYYQLRGLIRNPTKPLSTSSCTFMNQSQWLNDTFREHNTTLTKSTSFQPHPMFKTSFYFYTLFGALVTVIIGLLISYVTKTEDVVDSELLTPIYQSRRRNCHFNNKNDSQILEDAL